MKEMSPTQLHAYSPDQGLPEVRKAVAEYLNGTFSMTYAPEDIYMTSGRVRGPCHRLPCAALAGGRVYHAHAVLFRIPHLYRGRRRRHARGTLRAGDVPARL